MGTTDRTYLDYNAGAPLRPEARAAMIAALGSAGNASSVHTEGRNARRLIEQARAAVAALVGADPRNVTFVSGGSEANVTVLTPAMVVAGKAHNVDRLLVGATEHPSVLSGGRFAKEKVAELPVDDTGRIRLKALENALSTAAEAGESVLVSVMLANNETGTIQPVAEIAEIAHRHGALVHSDAAQAVGRIPVGIAALGVDFLTLSGHKIGGPQGTGAVVQRSEDVAFTPLITGGGQEHRRRAGTENVAAIAGFGEAATAALRDLAAAERWQGWRDRLAGKVADWTDVTIFSQGAERLPQTLCLGVSGMSAETLVIGLDLEGVAVSSGAACSSGKVGPSHVLAAMGVAPEAARSAIRVSFGWDTDETDLDRFESALRRVVERVWAAGDERAA
jgi:cysteine desulfurase